MLLAAVVFFGILQKKSLRSGKSAVRKLTRKILFFEPWEIKYSICIGQHSKSWTKETVSQLLKEMF